MSDTLDLFGGPPSPPSPFPPATRSSDPATSRAAEERMKPRRGTKNEKVLALFLAYPKGLNAKEVENFLRYRDARTGELVTNWWRRASDLKHLGLIVPTGIIRDGSEVYVAAEYATLDTPSAGA